MQVPKTDPEKLKQNFGIAFEGDILSLVIRGNIGGLNLSALQQWTAKVFQTVKSEYAKRDGRKIRVIISTSGIKGYEPDALTALANLMRDDEPYVLKTATYGAGPLIRLAEEIVFSLSGRDNCRAFKTKEEALAWLNS